MTQIGAHFKMNLDHRMPVRAVRCPLLSVLHLANMQIHTLISHTLLLLTLPLPNPMLKQLCPVCESSTGSVRVIDDAVSTGNMF